MASLINYETAEGVVATVHLTAQDAERLVNGAVLEVYPSRAEDPLVARVRIEVAPP